MKKVEKNLIVLEDNRLMRNSIVSAASFFGKKPLVAGSLAEFREIAAKKGNEFIKNSSLLLDVNLPDGTSNQIIKEFNIKENFVIFTAMHDEDFKKFKATLEESPIYKDRVLTKKEIYTALEILQVLTEKNALANAKSLFIDEIGIFVENSSDYLILTVDSSNRKEVFGQLSANIKEKDGQTFSINLLSPYGQIENALSNSLKRLIEFLFIREEKIDKNLHILRNADFHIADVNLTITRTNEIKSFDRLYQELTSRLLHGIHKALHDIKESARKFIE
jgi:hypothetical protein